VFETSDLPGGVVNIVTGSRDTLAKVLAEHDDVEAIWYCGSDDGVKMIELASASNMKRTWCPSRADWLDDDAEGREFLRESVQVKNIWIPYGE
jgi:aldehyde dehydrogenase (NAD+)